jgi:hypothetical protein
MWWEVVSCCGDYLWNYYTKSRCFVDQIHERLRHELQRLGLKGVDAARQAGIDAQGLRDVLGGRKRLPAEMLGALTIHCGVDALSVLTGQPSQPQAASTVSEGDRVLLDNFHAAPAQVQAGVKTTLEAFEPAPAGKRKTKAA